MHIKLVDDWKRIALKAWSMRWMYLATLLGAGEPLLPLFTDAIPRGTFAALTVVALFAGIVSRVIQQQELHING